MDRLISHWTDFDMRHSAAVKFHIDAFRPVTIFTLTTNAYTLQGTDGLEINTSSLPNLLRLIADFALKTPATRASTKLVCRIVGFDGQIICDTSKPDGAKAKLLDVAKLNNLGWKSATSLEEGIASAYQAFLSHLSLTAAIATAA